MVKTKDTVKTFLPIILSKLLHLFTSTQSHDPHTRDCFQETQSIFRHRTTISRQKAGSQIYNKC